MCTVTFYRSNNKTIITSNRDENINRSLAEAPRRIACGNSILYYPIDPVSIGTWFCVKNNGNVLVLLNGADIKHIHNPPYRKSRGLILLDIMQTENYQNTWAEIDLANIEPFTLVAFDNKKLIQYRWNGVEKTDKELDHNVPHIWSSSTLYSHETKANRKEWFSQFLNQNKVKLDAKDFLKFHSTANIEDKDNGLIINRNNLMLTKNITQFVLEKSRFTLMHQDLILNKKTIISEKIYEDQVV